MDAPKHGNLWAYLCGFRKGFGLAFGIRVRHLDRCANNPFRKWLTPEERALIDVWKAARQHDRP